MTNIQIKQEVINKALWSACDTFRGTVSADTYKDFILAMLFLKYLSDIWLDYYDEYKREYDNEGDLIQELMQNERFVLPQGSSFYDLYKQRYEHGNGERIDQAFFLLESANSSKLRDASKSVFQDISFNTNKLGEEHQKNTILRQLLEDFAKPELDLRPSNVGSLDIIGNAYEYLIKLFAAGGGQKAGEFYTPPEISDLIAELLNPQEGATIYDPACGSGSLLIKCARQIRKRFNSKKYSLYGQEAIGSTWSLAKMNMFLHGEDNHKIEWGDTIRNPKFIETVSATRSRLMLFDIVIANPPFSLDKWGYEDVEDDRYGRFQRGMPPKAKGDYAFILHMIETMKPVTGRMGVVVPHGVLFRSGAEGKIRRQLIEEGLLECVIGLPEKLFYGTSISAAVLIFTKERRAAYSTNNLTIHDGDTDKDNNILFIDASREFKSGRNQNIMAQQEIKKIVDVYQNPRNIDQYSYLAAYHEIKGNDFNLNISRYVNAFEEDQDIDLRVILDERERLKTELSEMEILMDNHLKDLGYSLDQPTDTPAKDSQGVDDAQGDCH